MNPIGDTWRAHRAHVELTPVDYTIRQTHTGRIIRGLSAYWDTDRFPVAFNDADQYPAPLELIVTRGDDGDLVYTASFDTQPGVLNGYNSEQFESSLLEAYGYADATLLPQAEAADIAPVLADEARVFSLTPPDVAPTHDGRVPMFRAGSPLGSVIGQLDRLAGGWALQVLAAPSQPFRHPVTWATDDGEQSLDYALQVNVIVPAVPVEASADRGHVEQALLDFETVHPEFGLKPSLRTDAQRAAVVDAIMDPVYSFPVTAGYLQGFVFPPDRDIALRFGLGAPASRFDRAPRHRVAELVEPDRLLGGEPPPHHQADDAGRAKVGLPELPAAVAHVEPAENRLPRLERQLPDAIRTPGPTVIIAEDRSLLERCAELSMIVADDTDGLSVRDPAHYFVDALGVELDEDGVGRLASGLDDLLRSDEQLVLFDLSRLDAAGEAASLLGSALSDAGYRVRDPDTAAGHLADVFVACPAVADPENRYLDKLAFALRHTTDTGLSIDLSVPYPRTETERSTVESLVDAADWLLADNSGPAGMVIPDHRLSTQDVRWARRLEEQLPAAFSIGVVDGPTAGRTPFVLPLQQLIHSRHNADTAELTLRGESKARLQKLLGRPATGPALGGDATGGHRRSYEDLERSRSRGAHFHRRRTGLPSAVRFNDARDSYECHACTDTPTDVPHRRPADAEGLRIIIECCHTLADVDREALRRFREPRLQVTAEEIAKSAFERPHFLFMKACYLVLIGKADPFLEYDPIVDPGTVLLEDFGLDVDDVRRLQDAGYVTEDNHPHVLYSLTKAGQKLLGEPWKASYEFGPGVGELHQTLQHRMMVRAAKLYLEATYGDRPDVRVETYVPVTIRLADDGGTETKNLDVAVLDRDDNIIAAIAADRENKDRKRSNVDSYRKMVAADPNAAIFVVRNKTEADHLLEDLYEASEANKIPYNGPLYSETTQPADYNIDQPGLTGIMTIRTLLKQFDHEWT